MVLTRDINPFGVRMPSDLKQRLDFKAKENNRSLNSEIVSRLADSLDHETANVAKERPATQYRADIHPIEQQLLVIFRRLPAEKQLALISLFK